MKLQLHLINNALTLVLLSTIALTTQAQNNVGIGTTTPNSKAILELKATDKGFIAPRMTTAQMLAIAPTATEAALLVYNTDSACYHFYNGTTWKNLCQQALDTALINKAIKNYLNSNATTIINILKGDTALFNYTTINNAIINILTVDTSITNVAIINNATIDTAVINYANINNATIDSSKTNYAYITNGQIDTLKSNAITTNTITANTFNGGFANMDSLYIGGQNITKTISDSIAAQAWLLKGNNAPVSNKLGTLNARDLHIVANNQEKITIANATGYVGINQALPTQHLDVAGNLKFDLALMPAGAAGTNGDLLVSQGAGTAPQWKNGSTLAGTLNNVSWSLLGNSSTNSATNFIGTTDAQNLVFKTNSLTAMTLTTNGILLNGKTGNVVGTDGTGENNNSIIWGITTTGYVAGFYNSSLLAKSNGLVVKTASNAYNNTLLDLSTGVDNVIGTSVMNVRADGSVGIGVAAPTNKLHVTGLLQTGSYSTADGARFADNINGINIGGNDIGDYGWIQGSKFGIGAGNIAMQVHGGNVGIGTTTPLQTLHIGGNSSGAGNQTGVQIGDAGAGPGPLFLVHNNPIVSGNSYYNAVWKYGGGTGKPSQIDLGANGMGFRVSNVAVGAVNTPISDFLTTSPFNMFIAPSGNVGIGTTTPAEKLTIEGGNLQLGEIIPATGLGRRLMFSDNSNNSDYMCFQRENRFLDASDLNLYLGDNYGSSSTITDQFNIKCTNNTTPIFTVDAGTYSVSIGNTNPQATLDLRGPAKYAFTGGNATSQNGPSRAIIPAGDGATYRNDWQNLWGGGLATWDVVGESSFFTNYYTRSDSKLKKDIVIMNTNITNSFMQLRPVTYLLKQETPETEGLQYGFIAQEVAKLFPSIVTKDSGKEGATIGMNYQALIAPTVHVVQQQQRTIEAQQAQIDELKKQNEAILKLLQGRK